MTLKVGQALSFQGSSSLPSAELSFGQVGSSKHRRSWWAPGLLQGPSCCSECMRTRGQGWQGTEGKWTRKATHPVVPSCLGHLSRGLVTQLRGWQESSLCRTRRVSLKGRSTRKGRYRAEEAGQVARRRTWVGESTGRHSSEDEGGN